MWYLELELVNSPTTAGLSPLQSAGPVGGGGEPVHGGAGGAPVCPGHLTPGDGGQGAGHRAASDQHLQNIIRFGHHVILSYHVISCHNVTESHIAHSHTYGGCNLLLISR